MLDFGFGELMLVALIFAGILFAIGFALYKANMLKQAMFVFCCVLLLGGVALSAGHAEEDLPEGVHVVVKTMDFGRQELVLADGEGETYCYKTKGMFSVGTFRIAVKDGNVDKFMPEIKVEAELTGFELSTGTFKLRTVEGEEELFDLQTGTYNIGDKYVIYYAEGFKPICRRIE